MRSFELGSVAASSLSADFFFLADDLDSAASPSLADPASSGATRSNLRRILLPRRKACFKASNLWRAFWAADSSEPKSKSKNEWAMRIV